MDYDKLLNDMQDLASQIQKKAEFVHTEKVHDQLRFLRHVRDITETLSDYKSQLQKHLDRLRQEVIPTTFKENNITSLTVDGFRYVISHNWRASIKGDRKGDAYKWLRDNDLGELITETVNASTLSAQAKKMTEDGMELDPDLFTVNIVPNTSITQAK